MNIWWVQRSTPEWRGLDFVNLRNRIKRHLCCLSPTPPLTRSYLVRTVDSPVSLDSEWGQGAECSGAEEVPADATKAVPGQQGRSCCSVRPLRD